MCGSRAGVKRELGRHPVHAHRRFTDSVGDLEIYTHVGVRQRSDAAVHTTDMNKTLEFSRLPNAVAPARLIGRTGPTKPSACPTIVRTSGRPEMGAGKRRQRELLEEQFEHRGDDPDQAGENRYDADDSAADTRRSRQ